MPLEFKMYSYIGPEPLRTTVPLLPATRKSTASSSAQTPPPSGLPPPPAFANSYILDIVSALRGQDHNFLSRAAVADAISAIDNEEHKLQLIDFLVAEQGAIAMTLENSACKAFECTPGELFVLAQRVEQEPTAQQQLLAKLVQMFQTILRKIIPNTFGMLYPLQHFDSTFQLREIILHYFRDRVLLSLLDNFHFDRSQLFEDNNNFQLERELRQMFLMINLDVRDESDESDCFGLIFDNFLGLKNEIQTQKADDEGEDGSRENDIIHIPKQSTNSSSSSSSNNNARGRRPLQRGMRVASSTDPECPPSPSPSSAAAVAAAAPGLGQQRGGRKSFSPSPKLLSMMSNANGAANGKAEEESTTTASAATTTPSIQQQQKQRARTMPSKTVTFWDEESTVDV